MMNDDVMDERNSSASPLMADKWLKSDVARAINVDPAVIRNWTAQLDLFSGRTPNGSREYSTADVAVYALVKAFTGLGLTVREAGDIARPLVLTGPRLLFTYKNTPDRVLAAHFINRLIMIWRDDAGAWCHHSDLIINGIPTPASAFGVVMLGEVIGEALARLEGDDNA